MYLISAYFDEQANKTLERYIQKIAKETGNTFMLDNHVPPHLTISQIEARNGELLIPCMEKLCETVTPGKIQIVSVGALFPYVLYGTPVLSEYLQNLSKEIYEIVKEVPETSVSKYYQPMQWLPHVTLGKTLSKEQMQMAFALIQEEFMPLEATITKIGLAKTNPHEDIWETKLSL